MDHNAQVSNRKERASAIFKTLGIYLITFILLIFIFKNKGNTATDQSSTTIRESTQLKSDIQDLQTVLSKLSEIATLINEYLDLDEQNRDTPGSKEQAMEKIDLQIRTLYEEVYRLTQSESLMAQQQYADSVYDTFKQLKRKVQDLRGGLTDKQKEWDAQQEEQELAVREERAEELEQSINNQKQNQAEESNLSKCETEKINLQQDLATAQNQVTAAKEDYDNSKQKIRELLYFVQNERSNTSPLKNWKSSVESIHTRVASIYDGM